MSSAMQTMVLCYAAADAEAAGELGQYLETNCTFALLQAAVVYESGEQLVEAVEQALSADFVIVLLSGESVPKVWRRPEWEPVFVDQPRELGTKLGWLMVGACRFPELLRRGRFFDSSVNRLAGFREAKRWLMSENSWNENAVVGLPGRSATGHTADLGQLERELADRPGTVWDVARETALEFAHAHQADFEGVFWIDGAYRSRAGLVGATGHLLGLKLRERTGQNSVLLREKGGERRCLFVFEGVAEADRDLVMFSENASVILTEAGSRRGLRPLGEVEAAFSRADCWDVLGDAQAHVEVLVQEGRHAGGRLAMGVGSRLFRLLRDAGRLAEADEVLGLLIESAWGEGEAAALRGWMRERSWIREEWGEIAPQMRLGTEAEAKQLDLGLGD